MTVKFQPGITVYDAHVNYFCHISDVKHVQTCTRPSPFSACNIEKSGGPGDKAMHVYVQLNVIHVCIYSHQHISMKFGAKSATADSCFGLIGTVG